MQCLVEITTLQERATYFGLFGACFGLASILGPLVGGALTDHATWRWCCEFFRCYLILKEPFVPQADPSLLPLLSLHKLADWGYCVRYARLVSSLLLLHPSTIIADTPLLPIHSFLQARPALGAAFDKRSLLTKIIQIDWVGLAISICFTTIICLGLEYGGVTKPWDDPSVIALLVLIPVSLGVLVAWTLWLGPDRAMLPIGLLRRFAFLRSFFAYSTLDIG